MSSIESRKGRLAATLLALGAAIALTAALASPARAESIAPPIIPPATPTPTTFGAAPSSAAVFATASHDKGRTLSGQGVTLLVGNGGTAQGDKLTLPIAHVHFGTQPAAVSAASLTFKKGKASVLFTDVRLNLSAGTIVGKLAGTETSIFRVEGAPQVNATSGVASLSGGKLKLIGTTAKTLQDELALARALNQKGVGQVWLAAQAKPTQVKRAITSGNIDWDFLTSWREYIYKELGPGSVGSITTQGGAGIIGEPGKAGSYFVFPYAGGTGFSGGSVEDGLFGASSALPSFKTTGSVNFAKPGHCIVEIRFSNLEARINGAGSGLYGNLNYNVGKPVGKTCEAQPPVSLTGIEIASFNTSGVTPVYSNGGTTITWANVPATLTAAAAPPFSPQYKAGQALDPVTITVGVG